jgi:hypothetical protein
VPRRDTFPTRHVRNVLLLEGAASHCWPSGRDSLSSHDPPLLERGARESYNCREGRVRALKSFGARLIAVATRARAVSGRRRRGQEHQTELAHLDLVTVGQHRRVDQFTIDIGAVEAVDVDDLEFLFSRRNSAWCWLTVTSSRTMSLSACRPADVTGRSSGNRDPALGPRFTTSKAAPLGSPSTRQSLLLTCCSLSDGRGHRRILEVLGAIGKSSTLTGPGAREHCLVSFHTTRSRT